MAIFEPLRFGDFEGQLARPDRLSATRAPAVLIMADAFGINEFSVGQAGRLADLGFIALAGDLYGGGFHASNQTEVGEKFSSVVDDDVVRTRVRDNMDALAAVPGVDRARLGAIGYCLGGRAVLELARSGYDVRSVVSFHGLLTTTKPAVAGSIRASILVCTGADDPYAPLEDVAGFQAEMTASNADCQVIVYTGTQHSWTTPTPPLDSPGIGFHERNAKRAWDAMLAFFEDTGLRD